MLKYGVEYGEGYVPTRLAFAERDRSLLLPRRLPSLLSAYWGLVGTDRLLKASERVDASSQGELSNPLDCVIADCRQGRHRNWHGW